MTSNNLVGLPRVPGVRLVIDIKNNMTSNDLVGLPRVPGICLVIDINNHKPSNNPFGLPRVTGVRLEINMQNLLIRHRTQLFHINHTGAWLILAHKHTSLLELSF